MNKVFLIVSILICCTTTLLSNDIYDQIEIVISNQKNTNEIYLITSLDICVSCNQSKMKAFLKKIEKEKKYDKINLIIESENAKDSYYLKKVFKNVNFIEDNSVYITKKVNSPFVVVVKQGSNVEYFQVSNISNLLRPESYNSLKLPNNIFSKQCNIEEDADEYLSRIKVIDNQQDLKIFDYSNQSLKKYDNEGYVLNKTSFKNTYQFYEGNKDYIAKLEEDGVSFSNFIKSFYLKNDTAYIFYDRVLQNIEKNEKGEYGIDVRSVVSKYVKGEFQDSKIMDLKPYLNYFYVDQTHIVEYFIPPSSKTDSSEIYSEVSFDNKKKSKKHYDIDIRDIDYYLKKYDLNYSDIVYKTFIKSGSLIVITQNNILVYIEKNKSYAINLKGIVDIQENIRLLDIRQQREQIFIVLKDRINLYIQKYDLVNNILDKEYVSGFSDGTILDSKIYRISESAIELINRWKEERWRRDIFLLKE